MSAFPYEEIPVDWKRPPIDKQVLRDCTRRSDILALLHCAGTLAILGATGTFAYLMFLYQQWVLLAVALYIHGGVFAFNPQTHELSHNNMFRTRWLNRLFKRIFGLVHWSDSNSALYRMSHMHHHRYTLHRRSEGEVVQPKPEPAENILQAAVLVVNPTALLLRLYDRVYGLAVPFERNPRRSVWHRYVYSKSTRGEQRDVFWTDLTQLLFHVAFGAVAIYTGLWFLIVVVSLPAYYGGKWYHVLVHDTMHVGCEPETDDFRKCCRSVKVDPITSFLYWHMEYHTEHHAFPGIPCYRLKEFHRRTREHWKQPQTLVEAWREMNRFSEEQLAIAAPDAEVEAA
jgi:fatty acid desaturase